MKSGVVVFGYHNMGVTGIETILNHGILIHAVFTHRDETNENIWFNSVSELCRKNKINYYYADECNNKKIIEIISTYHVSVIFSFYYRNMLPGSVLKIPNYGAVNLHGSMLPKYRGRSPVNWQLINGETQGGVTLHYMTDKPDAGDIIDQEPVVITKQDDPLSLYSKLNKAAEVLLDRRIDEIVIGTCDRKPQDHTIATYYGGRKPEDGLIDWAWGTEKIYNLIRGVTKPYPGAFTYYLGKKLLIWKSSTLSDTQINLSGNGSFCSYDDRVCVRTGDGVICIEEYSFENIEYDLLNKSNNVLHKGIFNNIELS